MEEKILRFLYNTLPGRILLKAALFLGFPKLAACFLRSPLSKPWIRPYVQKHQIALEDTDIHTFKTFADFFTRQRKNIVIDLAPTHLISPCDGWLSVCKIQADSCFAVKGSVYCLRDLLQDEALGGQFYNGLCLIIRLCASDYHHYCYLDAGTQDKHHFIEGTLHSVQAMACSTYPVYRLNRRCWTLLYTKNFGVVAQIEIGALAVGGIVNQYTGTHFYKGMEMGHFELAGSTILLLFQENKIQLLPQITEALKSTPEVCVTQGMWIGTQAECP